MIVLFTLFTANCRAELAVKSAKRTIMDKCSPSGSLDVDSFQTAMLSYKNSIDPVTGFSPALAVFGRQIRDGVPVLRGKFNPHHMWKEKLEYREKAMAERHNAHHEAWSEHTKKLVPLEVGMKVFVQNQVGNKPRRWDKTGTIVECKDFDQYLVKMDGSGRLTLRNRKFLRKRTPLQRREMPVRQEFVSSHLPPVMPVLPPVTPDQVCPDPSLAPHTNVVRQAPPVTSYPTSTTSVPGSPYQNPNMDSRPTSVPAEVGSPDVDTTPFYTPTPPSTPVRLIIPAVPSDPGSQRPQRVRKPNSMYNEADWELGMIEGQSGLPARQVMDMLFFMATKMGYVPRSQPSSQSA